MNDQQGSPVSSSDLKKWGVFALFLVVLAVLVYFLALQPGGETEARRAIEEAEALNEQARAIAARTQTPQDLANVDLSSEALRKAKALLVEHDFGRAGEEALRSKNQSNKVIDRQSTGSDTRARVRFQDLRGEVSVKKRFTPEYAPAQPDLALDIGDAIRSGEGGSARLQFSSQMEVMLSNGASLTIPDLPVNQQDSIISEIFLESGTILVRVSDQERKSGVLNNNGKVTIFPGSELWVTQLENGGLFVRVGRGRAEVRNREGTANVLLDQQVTLPPDRAPGPPENLPAPPELISPDNFSSQEANQNGYASVTLSWRPTVGQYQVEVSDNPMFNGFVQQLNNYRRESINFPNIREGTYFWRVYSIDQGRTGIPSQARQFEVTGPQGEVAATAIDDRPPLLQVYRDKVLVQGYVAIIQGKVERGSSVSVEGETAFVDSESGEFRCTLNFPGRGIYTLNIIATDRSGNHAREELKVEIRD